ncbi:T9SS type B sorting domain-containing protein [Ascidiimonas sp. W6]|uniref:T9SS type B sorting domain-containing protein n=1 Tax=Ascidiimonas meishanensis TaxID=3128903 RepID=UPI0030ECBAC2
MNLQRLIFLLCAVLATGVLSAQREASNWYFGRNAGLRFNGDGTVIPLLDGELSTNEGCASISDKFGNLLFYTDGITIWDRTNGIMTNGTGLLGDPSSTQSALIVPKPDDNDIYYVFTVNALGGDIHDTTLLQGLNYYIVDMSVGANGAVVGRGNNNQPLLRPNSEKITAVRSADCTSIWLITQFLDSFYAYEISAAGVNTTPVISVTPTVVPLGGYRYNAIGYLKASPDGTKIAVAHSTVSNVTNRSAPGKLLLYNFDTATGQVSNEQELNIDNRSPYGIEFSPSNEILYVTTDLYDGFGSYVDGKLFQYDLLNADIDASRFQLGEFINGALQLGPNGKIYGSQFGSGALNVINNPNERGAACNFVAGQQALGGRFASFGLPPFIQSLFNEVVNILGDAGNTGNTDLVICENESYTFNTPVIPGATYTWTFEDTTNNTTILPGNSNTYTLANATVNDSGIYKLEIDRNDGSCPIEGFAFVTVNPLPPSKNTILTQCDFDEANPSDGITLVNLEQASAELMNNNLGNGITFHESPADLQNGVAIASPENYRNTNPFNQTIYVKITAATGCFSVAELILNIQSTIVTDTNIQKYYACDLTAEDTLLESSFDLELIRSSYAPLEATFYTNRNDAALELNALSGNFLTSNTQLFVRLESAGQCQGIELIEFVIDPLPVVNYPDEVFVCLNELPGVLIAEPGFENYRWYKIEGNTESEVSNVQTAAVTETGRYRLQLTRNYTDGGIVRSCSNSKFFEVIGSDVATINRVVIRDFSDNNSITIEVSGEGDYEYAINDINGPYQDANVFDNITPGAVIIYVRDKNNCGIADTEIFVLGYPKFFTPNGDGFNDLWQIVGARSGFDTNSKLYIFDRYGKPIKEMRLNDRGWDGTFNGTLLPSADYWFWVILEDGRQFKGHFTLKR